MNVLQLTKNGLSWWWCGRGGRVVYGWGGENASFYRTQTIQIKISFCQYVGPMYTLCINILTVVLQYQQTMAN